MQPTGQNAETNTDASLQRQINDAVAEAFAKLKLPQTPAAEPKRSRRPDIEKFLMYAIPSSIVALGFYHDAKAMFTHFWGTIINLADLIMAAAGVMVIIGFIQIARESRIFDKFGVASEMNIIQERIGTEDERESDSRAIGIKHAGISVLIALVMLTYAMLPETA